MSSRRIDPEAKLVEADSKQPGVRWPLPIDLRLDQLVAAANDVGAATTRQELLAALVLSASSEPQQLHSSVLQLRTASVKDASTVGEVHRFPIHGPGRRPRRGKE
jgi:hypothetical protein